jgi:hypothetical protein
LAAQPQNAPKHYAASAEDRLRVTPDAPLSLQSGAGRQYCDEVLRLLVQIRTDGDAVAERLGYGSDNDDGLAAVEYIANKILQAVRGERQQQQIARAKVKPATSPPEGPHQSFAGHKTRRKPRARIASDSERSKWIGELKQMLRDGQTKAGVVIDPPLAHEIAKHITVLNEELAQPETTESIKRIRERLARFFGKVSGDRTKPGPRCGYGEKSKAGKDGAVTSKEAVR